ncbi:unnamed protein product [Mortierella alpina]
MATGIKKDTLLLKSFYIASNSAAFPGLKTSVDVNNSVEVHIGPLKETSVTRSKPCHGTGSEQPRQSPVTRSGLSVFDGESSSRIQNSPVRDRVQICCSSGAKNPFLVGPLESLLQCVFDHYSNRKYILPMAPKEFPSKNIEILFQAARQLLKKNIEDKLALLQASLKKPELSSALKKVLDRLFKNTYSAKEVMDEITLIEYEAIERPEAGSTKISMDRAMNSDVAAALEIIHYL